MKKSVERLSNNSVWLEPPSDLDEVRKLIGSLAPVAIEQALIRIGGEADGGYLIPDDLSGIAAAISPGVSTEIGFDIEMAKLGIDVIMADASVAGPPEENACFHFHQKYVDVFEDEHNIRLDSLCASNGAQGKDDLILQMDIEGAEYRVLLDTNVETLKRFRIMVIEFHLLDRMFARFPFHMIRAVFQKLLQFHNVVHIHPNNGFKPVTRSGLDIPPVMEFTFYRKDRFTVSEGRSLEFPHYLDRDNLAHCPSLVLPHCWQ